MSWRRILRLGLLSVLAVFISLVVLEVVLNLGALFVEDRADTWWREGATVRVLAVGDSHTYGASVAKGMGYPSQTQRFLDKTDPGTYSVINIGVPGFNTSQVRNRLEVNLARWQPSILVLWCGLNNVWNNAERKTSRIGTMLDGWALRLRTYKLARVWWHDIHLQAGTSREMKNGRHVIKTIRMEGHKVPFFGDVFADQAESPQTGRETQEWIFEDLSAMVNMARNAGIKVLLIKYQHEALYRFAVTNRAIERVGKALDIPVVNARDGYLRVPEGGERDGWAFHPGRDAYREIGRDVAKVIVEL